MGYFELFHSNEILQYILSKCYLLWNKNVNKLYFWTKVKFIIKNRSIFSQKLSRVWRNSLMLSTRQAGADDRSKIVKNVKIIDFQYYIWNHRGKCIQISTNMPAIGLVNNKILVNNINFVKKKKFFKPTEFCIMKPMVARYLFKIWR